MLLIHQSGSVKVGEVVRYTVTYTPTADRILPTPQHLHVKIKNTSAIPLRAAYLHGPYTLHVSAYPSVFNPNRKLEEPEKYGIPEFEPMLKAGANWQARLTIPEDIRENGSRPDRWNTEDESASVTWIIEIASQILFSASASVDFELLVGRDEKSLELGFAAVAGYGHGAPAKLQDHQQGPGASRHPGQAKGVYSRAINLLVEDTTSLWNKPALPKWDSDDYGKLIEPPPETHESQSPTKRRLSKAHSNRNGMKVKQKKFHLVVLTHGLHSNVSADMLYLKESIDASAKEACERAKARRRAQKEGSSSSEREAKPNTTDDDDENDEEDEEVLVRGFTGNVTRTERGIQYLGKRLAKHILTMTYPDQPYLPTKKSMTRSFSRTFSSHSLKNDTPGPPSHSGSSIHRSDRKLDPLPYKFTSISFIGHSLGGIVQTYAIAYIHKHSPQFFEIIKPINFIGMASPMLGLSNENPMYVKFALDFGLVGRTGQDLGLTWRPTTITRNGWSAMIGGLGSTASNKPRQEDPGSKPLLRILPTGPAHQVLLRFRNRTVYSNVVNDGIVPLRTSCLLFLDWRGLDKAVKARRENGLIGTVASWGWKEITGENSSPNPSRAALSSELDNWDSEDGELLAQHPDSSAVPQPPEGATTADDEVQTTAEPKSHQFLNDQQGARQQTKEDTSSSSTQDSNPFSSLWSFLRPNPKPSYPNKPLKAKTQRLYSRSQTLRSNDFGSDTSLSSPSADSTTNPQASSSLDSNPQSQNQDQKRPMATRGDSLLESPSRANPPPKTSLFEAAGDILSPPIPPTSWLIDPSKRPRTIFHDRVYHPEDIPPPPPKKASKSLSFTGSTDSPASTPTSLPTTPHLSTTSHANSSHDPTPAPDNGGGMRVEEKIARAYHRDLSWRKVLVRLEPDAHNNMVVRRMFANAYGWPVIQHLCDTHFGDTYAAETQDDREPAELDRAEVAGLGVRRENGEEVLGQSSRELPGEGEEREERVEARDEVGALRAEGGGSIGSGGSVGSGSAQFSPKRMGREDSLASSTWDDAYFEGSSDDDDEDDDGDDGHKADGRTAFQRFLSKPLHKGTEPRRHSVQPTAAAPPGSPPNKRTSPLHRSEPDMGPEQAQIAERISASPPPVMEGHRGLIPTPSSPGSPGREDRRSAATADVGKGKERGPRSPGGTSEVGLSGRKGLEEQMASVRSSQQGHARTRSGSFGVAEQVARMAINEREQ
ncbi:MAG: hypothetical protein M1821_001138 [Bathelium mastoideum]|nr:MAG: hypothetical protein M1821_001138 [Bathelium mastoideum]